MPINQLKAGVILSYITIGLNTIINLVSNTVQGIADYLNDNIGNIPDTGGESVSMMEFVNNTPVDTLETTSKTIVGSINELKESSGGSSVDIVTTISARV